MQGPIERRAPKRLWKLAPPRPGAAAPLDPGWGRLRPQTPEKLRSGSGKRKGCGPLPGCKGCKGCFSKGCEWLGLGNRLWRFPKGFWGMVGYGREIGWGTCKVAGNRSVPGGGGVWRPGGPIGPPARPTTRKGRGPLGRPALALCALRAPAAPPRGRNVLHIPPGVPAPQPVAAGRQGAGQTRWKWRAAYAASITTGIRPKNRTSSPTIMPSTIQIGLLLGEDAGWVKGCRFWGKG